MKRILVCATLAVVLAATLAIAQTAPKLPRTYQVTGPVLELTDDLVVVEKVVGKDKERWELARTKDTKTTWIEAKRKFSSSKW